MVIYDWIFPHRRQLAKLRDKADRLQEWFDSAMVMVDNVPLGIAWSDPQRDFVITYMNISGRTMLDGVVAEKGASLTGKQLGAVFPPLRARSAELSDPDGAVVEADDFGSDSFSFSGAGPSMKWM